jgi:hypothetical protein
MTSSLSTTSDEKPDFLRHMPMSLPFDAPARPDGKSWHKNHWQAAHLRAYDVQWQEVADRVGVSYQTARNYMSLIEGFQDLIDYFTERRLKKKRDDWLAGEESWILDGIKQAHKTLFKLMAGEKLADGCEVPDPETSRKAAECYLKAIGYQEAKILIARLKAKELAGAVNDAEDDGDWIDEIDPRIEYEDCEDSEIEDAEYE